MTSNEEKLDQTHSQLNNRGSWLFTHIADVLLGRKIKKAGEGATGDTTLASEIAWNADNFKLVRNGIGFGGGVFLVKAKEEATVFSYDMGSGSIRAMTSTEFNLPSALGVKVHTVPKKTLDELVKVQTA